MSEPSLSSSLASTLANASSIELTGKLTEFALDQALDSGLLKDIPVVGWLAKLHSAGTAISDRILLNKILRFMTQLKKLGSPEKKEFREKISSDRRYAQTVGERLILALNGIDDPPKAETIAVCFDHFITGHLSYNQLCECIQIIDRLLVSDLALLAVRQLSVARNDWGRFLAAGAASFTLEEPSLLFDDKVPTIHYSLSEAAVRLHLAMLGDLREKVDSERAAGRSLESLFGSPVH
jgi:hypothetical protein